MKKSIRKNEKNKNRICSLQIVIAHHIDTRKVKEISELSPINHDDGTATIEGELHDISAVYGFLTGLKNLAFDVLFLRVRRNA